MDGVSSADSYIVSGEHSTPQRRKRSGTNTERNKYSAKVQKETDLWQMEAEMVKVRMVTDRRQTETVTAWNGFPVSEARNICVTSSVAMSVIEK